MLKLKDILLLVSSFSGILVGILIPKFGMLFEPFPIYCMMGLLFFSFLSISLGAIHRTVTASAPVITRYLLIKLVLLPVAVFFLVRCLFPDYALAALLLSGISTGVASPFFANLLHANTPLVLCMVVIGSVLAPVSLPALVEILLGHSIQISFFAMVELLAKVIFIPLLLAEILKRQAPTLTARLGEFQYPLSLVFFTVTNLAIFSQYADFFFGQPSVVALSFALSLGLAAVNAMAGILFSWNRPLEDQLSMAISFGIVNNVLVLVFSSEFFSPLEPTVAALYTIPFFGLVLPLRAYRSWRVGRTG